MSSQVAPQDGPYGRYLGLTEDGLRGKRLGVNASKVRLLAEIELEIAELEAQSLAPVLALTTDATALRPALDRSHRAVRGMDDEHAPRFNPELEKLGRESRGRDGRGHTERYHCG